MARKVEGELGRVNVKEAKERGVSGESSAGQMLDYNSRLRIWK